MTIKNSKLNFKKDFPFFNVYPDMIYVDNAAVTQKPECVIQAIGDFYTNYNAPIYRSVYKLAEQATQKYEEVRSLCADFIGAKANEIAFTKGITDGINIIAESWASHFLNYGDEILITEAEHNSNIVPWQNLAEKNGLVLKWIPLNFDGTLNLETIDELITSKTKLISITAYSNVLGHIDNLTGQKNFLKNLISNAHKYGAKVLVDGAQLVPHHEVDVKDLGADFLVFSGHKILGPQGVGALYVSSELHEQLSPYQLGSGNITNMGFLSYQTREYPYLFESGTLPAANVVGFGAALKYLENVDFQILDSFEESLCEHLVEGLLKNSRIQILGAPENFIKMGHQVSFIINKVHSHDVAAILDEKNICVRAGVQCADILHKKMGFNDSIRVSFYLYNTHEDVDKILEALKFFEKNY